MKNNRVQRQITNLSCPHYLLPFARSISQSDAAVAAALVRENYHRRERVKERRWNSTIGGYFKRRRIHEIRKKSRDDPAISALSSPVEKRRKRGRERSYEPRIIFTHVCDDAPAEKCPLKSRVEVSSRSRWCEREKNEGEGGGEGEGTEKGTG